MKIKFKGNKTSKVSKLKLRRPKPELITDDTASPNSNIPLLAKALKGFEGELKKLKGDAVGTKQKRCYYKVEIAAHRARIRILEAA